MKKPTINPDALYWAPFNRFEILIPGAAVLDIARPGPADDAVAYWAPRVKAQAEAVRKPISPTPDKIREELCEYGAWSDTELADDDKNWERLVWMAACNIAEEDSRSCEEPIKSIRP